MLSLVIGALCLAGCGTGAPDPRVVVVCGTVINVSKEQQAAAAVEMESLPANSIIGSVIIPDWLRQRDEARACRKP